MSHSEGHVNFHFFRMGFYTETKCRALPPPEPDLPAAFEASRSLQAHGVGTLTRAPAPLPSSPPHAPLDPPSGPSPLSSRRTLPLPRGPSSRTLPTLLSLLASPQTLAVGSHSHCNRGNAWISAGNTRQAPATLEDARVTAAANHGAGAECAGPRPLPPPTLTPARPPPPPRPGSPLCAAPCVGSAAPRPPCSVPRFPGRQKPRLRRAPRPTCGRTAGVPLH